MAERLRRAQPAEVHALFDGWEETLIWSALQDVMGCFWACEDKPSAAICEIGDFLFFSGDAQSDAAKTLVQNFLEEEKFRILAARTEAQHEAVGRWLDERAKPQVRYAFSKETFGFDPVHLALLAENHPADVTLCLFDEAICRMALSGEWSRDLVSRFDSAEDFLSRGVGVAALQNGELIAGASSYTVWKDGIEIEVDTRKDQRGRGIATACAAKLVLECLRRGLIPSWDAANLTSAHIAEKLGFRPADAYPVWHLNEN